MDRELITLKALKRGKYGTRHLVAGDVFEAKPRDVRILIAIGKAEAHTPVAPVATPVPLPTPVTAKPGKPGKVVPLEDVAPVVAPVEPEPVIEPAPVSDEPASDDEA